MQLLFSNQPKELLHVSIFRPAHVAIRVVLPLLLVLRIVTAGTVGTGHPEWNRLEGHRLPWAGYVDVTHDGYAAAVPDQLHGLEARRIGLRRSCDNNLVHACP